MKRSSAVPEKIVGPRIGPIAFWLRAPGGFPSKKNRLRPGQRQKFHYDKELKQVLDGMVLAVRGLWRDRCANPLPKLTSVEYSLHFGISNIDSDLDGAKTTVLDLLKDAGVIVDDRARHIAVHGRVTFDVVPKWEEGVNVTISGVAV